ncbi:MAG: 2-phospho-L-lactate transferase [Chloroflexota bacterium]|nr:2-phospho-L-lactate transferase [Chloroflexota bacterium]MDE2884312.1 2-phospho-L-lactate transferase [Chloroflexota bacterium]
MPRVLAISGGVGGAKLALGLSRLLAPEELTVAVNTGDDETFHGLHVSPDVDTVVYALAGLTNPETGWGVAGDSFRALDALGRLGGETWFKLGDLDLAMHLRRTELLADGCTLTEATRAICEALGVRHPVVPMSDAPVRTIALTEHGEMAFQEYFVRHACEPPITGVRFAGADDAPGSPALSVALTNADAIVFCPSNPLVSIGPVLAVPGIRDAIERFAGPRIAVSPIVGGRALKGPAAKMMAELGEEVSNVGVARRYAGLVDTLVIDEGDAPEASAVEALGIAAHVTPTVMTTDADKTALAREVLALVSGHNSQG